MTLERPEIGAPAPSVHASDDAGAVWRLADHRGRVVVLIFHRHIH